MRFRQLFTGFALLGVGLLGVGVAAQVFAQAEPTTVSYQGVIELDGVPLQGNRSVRFFVHVDSPENDPAYCEQASILFLGGRYVHSIGSGDALDQCSQDFGELIRSRAPLFLTLAIQEPGQPFVVLSGSQRLAAVPYALSLTNHSGDVPVGSVIDWFRASDVTPIPDGFMIANGDAVTDPDSPLVGRSVPNLVGLFTRGVTQFGDMGPSDATNSHAHDFEFQPHTHGVFLASHRHTFRDDESHTHTLSAAGNHTHPLTLSVVRGDDNSGPTFPLFEAGVTASGGSHTHTVSATQVSGETNLNSSDAVSTGSDTSDSVIVESDASEHLPAYFGLIKIIRIK